MKPLLKFLIGLSVIANVALALVLVQGALEKAAGPGLRPAAKSSETTAAAAEAPSVPQVWAAVATEDMTVLPDRLRDAGFPPYIVRAIIAAQLHRDFAARRKAIEGAHDAAYWKSEAMDPKKQLALRQLSREEQKQLRAILGSDADADSYGLIFRDRGLAQLSPEKAEQVRNIVRDYEEQRSDFYSSLSMGGAIMFGQAEREKMNAIEKAQHADLAKVLSPQELELYDLMTSNTAQSLRYQLSAFNPTEQEFRALYNLRRDYDERMPVFDGMMTQEQSRARMDAEKQLNEQIKLALGADRYAEYERATDYNYRQTSRLVARLELPAETTDQLYAVQKEFEQKRRDSMKGVASRDQMASVMTALQQEAIAKVTPLLGGDKAVEAYKQYGGQWLTNMVPRMPAPRPGAAVATPKG